MQKEIIGDTIKRILDKKKIKLRKEEIIGKLETPPNPELGDYAFPCFFLAPYFKENPEQIAIEIRKEMGNSPKGFEDVKTQGPYLNFFLDRKKLSAELMTKIMKMKSKFGSFEKRKSKKVLIEFSQPNTHKAFHVGHIRGTSIGESFARITEFCGDKAIRVNYSGDTGMHVAKWIWCYKKYHSKEELKDDEVWIASIYKEAVQKLSKNKDFEMEVEEINRKLDSKEDEKLNKLWEKTREISIKSWKKIYEDLSTKFDKYYFESEVEALGKKLALKLARRRVAKKSEGALIVDLKDKGLGIWVLLRKDGTVLYSAKDLGLAIKKQKDFRFDSSYIFIADEQKLHFQQLIETLKMMRFKKIDNYHFTTFGLVRLPKGKMSSRTGETILYSDLIKELNEYSKKQIKKREPKISKKEIEERALAISISAIKFSMLRQSPNKTISFNKKEALNFEGDTGPYLLYSYARAISILKKAKNKKLGLYTKELNSYEIALIKKMSEFPKIVLRSYNNADPSYIANYSYQLSQIFNEFYQECPVIKSKNEKFRLSLVKSFRQVLENSLYLLGVNPLERM